MYMRTRCRFFYDVRAAANKAFPVKEGEAVTTGQVVINGFLFLRLFCPAIVAPQLYNLVDTDPDPRTSRILKVIARILQYLANFKTEIEGDIFTPDNARVVNAFLKDNQATMRSFIDTVCNRDKASLRVFGRVALPVDLERYGVGPGLRVWWKGAVGLSTHSEPCARERTVCSGAVAWQGARAPLLLQPALLQAALGAACVRAPVRSCSLTVWRPGLSGE